MKTPIPERGIIPARAGFTLAIAGPAGTVPRIIPARAGFTLQGLLRLERGKDHPRSRGVYWGYPAAVYRQHGSSPLARGLLPRLIVMRVRGPDHPRSRGVYRGYQLCGRGPAGSSPLARGLHPRGPRPPPRRRIIPARAGFTGAADPAGAAAQDHPRSRGVYAVRKAAGTYRAGSSPLARGLPLRCCPCPPVARIIPARAGFTAARRAGPRPAGDHPRSRGVYFPSAARRLDGSGSSPLARGLQLLIGRCPPGVRIIPARAGFTPRRPWSR